MGAEESLVRVVCNISRISVKFGLSSGSYCQHCIIIECMSPGQSAGGGILYPISTCEVNMNVGMSMVKVSSSMQPLLSSLPP